MATNAREQTLAPPPAPFRAEVRVPGDKSLSHRAYLLAAMATGVSEVENPGPGRDVAATRAAVGLVGATVDGSRVTGPGIDRWHHAGPAIDCGNSGTTMRLLAGALAGRPFRSTLTGDASLNRRPMQRLVAPLEALGASVELSEAGTVGGGDGSGGGGRRRVAAGRHRAPGDRLGPGAVVVRPGGAAGGRPVPGE
jgi:3-phosphoshikimate 1-carboxyvinyltransferase